MRRSIPPAWSEATAPLQTRVVLVGAGHTHLEVLRRFARRPLADCALTLLSPQRKALYSGMLPGVVAGLYPPEAAEIDADGLARAAGAEMVLGTATGLDLARRLVFRADAPPLAYDLLSLDVGSGPNHGGIAAAVPVKPIGGLLAGLASMQAGLAASGKGRIAVVGGGAAGVELSLALARRLPQSSSLTLLTADADILPGLPSAARRRLRASLADCGIGVMTGARVVADGPGGLRLADGRSVAADALLWATAAIAPDWLVGSGLALDGDGFVRVDGSLRAMGRNDVFAAGDVAVFEPRPVPHSGVYAVRAAPLLAANLRAASAGRRLRRWRPQRHNLYILTTSDGSAVAVRGSLTLAGNWAWRLKDWLDRRFVARLNMIALDAPPPIQAPYQPYFETLSKK